MSSFPLVYRNPLISVFLSCICYLTVAAETEKQAGYFPASVFATDQDRNEFYQRWYGEPLAAMREPSLLGWGKRPGEEGLQVYRFLWLRSFDRPVAVRVQKERDGKARLFLKILDGHDGDGKLDVEKTKLITDEEWLGLLKQIRASEFWAIATNEQHWYYNEDGMIAGWRMNDGAQWVLEGSVGGSYHVVARQSPKDGEHRTSGKYRDLCMYILKLSDLDLDNERIY